jgi:4-carboxymuconolactone decarboxylase
MVEPAGNTSASPERSTSAGNGVGMLGRLIGAEIAQAFRDDGEPYERALREGVVDYGYGAVWSSDALDLRTRILITVSVLAALGRTAELRTHLAVALGQQIPVEEIAEAFRHVGLYAGFPAALDGTRELRRTVERR